MDINSNFVEKQLEKLERIKKMYFNTPLIRLDVEYMKENYEVYSKYESVQMTGSIKDRLAYYVFKRGYETGKIKEGTKIVEVSSGNTGIAMSALAAYLGHEIVIVLPDWLSKERYKLLELYGAKLKLTTGENGFIDAVEIAKEYEKNGYFYPNQFACTENMQAHKETTAKEIYEQLNELGKSPEVFVAGVGSGGTCAGINEYVKENKLDMKVYLLEPFKSQSLTTKGLSNPRHMIQGIGDGFVPDLIDVDKYDGIVTVCDERSYLISKKIAEKGLSVGISSGANLLGALKLAKKYKAETGKIPVIVTVFADCAKKYLSCEFEQDKHQNNELQLCIKNIEVY